MEPSTFQDVGEADPIRQGDIIKIVRDRNARWGVIVTADCDIAQGKISDCFTFLATVTAEEYVEDVWARDELRRSRSKLSIQAADAIHSIDAKRDPSVTRMDQAQIERWVVEEGPELIVDALGEAEKAKSPLVAMLRAIQTALDESVTPFDRLQRVWVLQNRKPKECFAQIQNALNPAQLRTDLFFLPRLPNEKAGGFFVLLRGIQSTTPAEVFLTHSQMKIAGKQTGGYRIGRLNDRLRFALSQRMAYLFSRIGMHRAFEEDCSDAARAILTMRYESVLKSQGSAQ